MPPTEYLRFERDADAEKGRRTQVWDVIAIRGAIPLGKIAWYGAWRQYVYYPWPDTILANSCIKDISIFIENLMIERRSSGGQALPEQQQGDRV